MPRSRPPLTRRRVLEAALAIVDAEGLAALTMRRLSAALGVEAMSLYNHVRDKQDLLSGMSMLVLSGIEQPAEDLPWPEILTLFTERLYRAYRQHPDLAHVLERSTPTSVTVLAGMERVLAALGQTGLTPSEQVSAFRGLLAMCLGFVLVHGKSAADRPAPDDRPWAGWDIAAVSDSSVPHALRLAPYFEETPHEDDFQFMLGIYITALQTRSSARPGG